MGWVVLALIAWLALQFRPSRRAVWAWRWTTYWKPLGELLRAMSTMLWQGFIREPARAFHRWETARLTTKRTSATLDSDLDKLLGRE